MAIIGHMVATLNDARFSSAAGQKSVYGATNGSRRLPCRLHGEFSRPDKQTHAQGDGQSPSGLHRGFVLQRKPSPLGACAADSPKVHVRDDGAFELDPRTLN
jgi:hypothetical protein